MPASAFEHQIWFSWSSICSTFYAFYNFWNIHMFDSKRENIYKDGSLSHLYKSATKICIRKCYIQTLDITKYNIFDICFSNCFSEEQRFH